jgi:putative membrane protein
MVIGSRNTVALLVSGLLLIAAAAPASAGARAQNTTDGSGQAHDHSSGAQGDAGASKSVASSDRDFVMTAAHDGMMEVEMGRMAVERASSDDVKQFGQRMIDDHSKANEELMRIATSKGLTVPAQMDAKHQADMDKTKADMGKMTGADFDRHYISMMVKDHEKAVRLFEEQANNGKDADLKSFASTTLPTLQTHLQMARDIDARLKGAGKATQ